MTAASSAAMEPVEESPDDLLFFDEVAEILRRTPAAVRAMVHAGNAPPSAKIGKRRMFRRRDVMEWIDEQFDKASA
ncbi:helix-turn-helix domain-containing protein [Brevibacterium epidermidis]|jgi:predicted DNA-binding transcriptional regulator AlpA